MWKKNIFRNVIYRLLWTNQRRKGTERLWILGLWDPHHDRCIFSTDPDTVCLWGKSQNMYKWLELLPSNINIYQFFFKYEIIANLLFHRPPKIFLTLHSSTWHKYFHYFNKKKKIPEYKPTARTPNHRTIAYGRLFDRLLILAWND